MLLKHTIRKNYNVNVLPALLMMLMFVVLQRPASAQTMNTQMDHTGAAPSKPEDISPLLIGEKIPMVSLVDPDGKMVELSKVVMVKPTILVFYRGGWCPFCNRQLAALQELQPYLSSLGYQIIAISTDSPENLRSSIKKSELGYTLLSDADLNVTKQFGLAFKAPERYNDLLVKSTGGKDTESLLPVPSVFLVNKQGVIKFEYINPDFKERISAPLLKAVAGTLYSEL
ncbi:MAG: peroxiredoxin family protein [Pseudobacter sp.]|uniref:peroxiredoxin family protein n=1 Tax=Pseudobacter sp. TaxID=2045420 RepID=UPI003F7D118F